MAVESKGELRCPHGPRSLLAKILFPVESPGDHFPVFEVSCRYCVKEMRNNEPDVFRVLHRFDTSGKLVHSVIERGRDGNS